MEASTQPQNPLINPPVEADESPVAPTYQFRGDAGTPPQTPVAPEPAPEPVAATPPEPEEEPEDVVDTLIPKASSVQWTFGPNGDFAFIQRPLSFIAKMQWFSLVGDVLDKALSGDNGMSINSLLSAPSGRPGQLSMADFRDADTFIQAIGKLLAVAPDFLVRSYCIWLNVPDWQREIVAEVMAYPPEDGGLSDDQGLEIIEVFIDQNYEALDRFFRDRLAGLQKRIQARAAESSSRRSRR